MKAAILVLFLLWLACAIGARIVKARSPNDFSYVILGVVAIVFFVVDVVLLAIFALWRLLS